MRNEQRVIMGAIVFIFIALPLFGGDLYEGEFPRSPFVLSRSLSVCLSLSLLFPTHTFLFSPLYLYSNCSPGSTRGDHSLRGHMNND